MCVYVCGCVGGNDREYINVQKNFLSLYRWLIIIYLIIEVIRIPEY